MVTSLTARCTSLGTPPHTHTNAKKRRSLMVYHGDVEERLPGPCRHVSSHVTGHHDTEWGMFPVMSQATMTLRHVHSDVTGHHDNEWGMFISNPSLKQNMRVLSIFSSHPALYSQLSNLSRPLSRMSRVLARDDKDQSKYSESFKHVGFQIN